MPIEALLNDEKKERKTLARGIRWPRFIFVVLAFFIFVDTVINPSGILYNMGQIALFGMLYFIFYRLRRMQFDNDNLYIIKGGDETVVPFVSIISIKKSSTKVNGSRYYKILYKDEFNSGRTRRYFPSFFGESKSFITAVKKANPDVVHWDHPFFNH